MTLQTLFPSGSIVGMVHLPPLPGSPGWNGSMQAVIDRALDDAQKLRQGGLAGVIVENYGDVPFFPGSVPEETVAAMAVVTAAVVAELDRPVGVNVLRNDAPAALAVATAGGGAFIRVNVHSGSMFTDQGLLHGQAHRTLRRRRSLAADVYILADVFVKHGTPPPGLGIEEAARDARLRGLADALVVSGSDTGGATDPDDLARVRQSLPDTPLWVGSGASANTAAQLLQTADVLIVGSALERGGRAGEAVDPDRVARFMEAVRG